MKLTFIEWLTLLNPNTILEIVTTDNLIYRGKRSEGLNFEMTVYGFYLTNKTT